MGLQFGGTDLARVGGSLSMTICAGALEQDADSVTAIEVGLLSLQSGLADRRADLVVAFVSTHHVNAMEMLVDRLRSTFPNAPFIAVSGESIVGASREVEGAPALSLWAAADLPASTRVSGVRLEPNADPTNADSASQLVHAEGGSSEPSTLLLLADPFTFPADPWLHSWKEACPRMMVVGGMASAAHEPGINRLILDDEVYSDGAVGILLEGPQVVQSVVSQGCRPIGRPLLITKGNRNLISELGRRPSLEVFQEIFESLTADEQSLARKGLHLGRVINEYQDHFDRGDFLVRNVVGATEDGDIAITDAIRVGQTVQFHVRDAKSAGQDLRELLSDAPVQGVAGALLFTCNGRGTRLFDVPNHDITVIREVCGSIPVAGFFAMGELGPVGGQNFVHGFTASVALFNAT